MRIITMSLYGGVLSIAANGSRLGEVAEHKNFIRITNFKF